MAGRCRPFFEINNEDKINCEEFDLEDSLQAVGVFAWIVLEPPSLLPPH
jgi:hypothetical protein